MTRDDLLDSACLRIDLARSLLLNDALHISRVGNVSPELLKAIREHADALEEARREHHELTWGAGSIEA